MKRRLWTLVSVFALSLALTIPARAATEHGLLYDETELLYSDELDTLGTEVLPAFLDTYGIDLRVDILTTIANYADVAEAAASIYTEYDYGGSGGNGACLTLLVHEDADGVALEDWCIHFGGDSDEWTTHGPRNINRVYEIMAEENWSGNLEQDIRTLTDAVTAMVDGLEDFVLAGGVGDTIWNPFERESTPTEPSPFTGMQLTCIADDAALLTGNQRQELELQARATSARYGVGVRIITVNNYQNYTGGSIYDAADAFYQGCTLGLGEDRDCILLLLSMARRDYLLIAYGDNAKYAFNESGREHLDDFFLDDFGENEWYSGFSEYLTWVDDYLEQAENGTPYSGDHIPMSLGTRIKAVLSRVAIILLVPLAIAGIYVFILTQKMKSVAQAAEAGTYISGDLQLTRQSDFYTHTTETRTKIESSNSSGSRSGRSSGGGSGTHGKF